MMESSIEAVRPKQIHLRGQRMAGALAIILTPRDSVQRYHGKGKIGEEGGRRKEKKVVEDEIKQE